VLLDPLAHLDLVAPLVHLVKVDHVVLQGPQVQVDLVDQEDL